MIVPTEQFIEVDNGNEPITISYRFKKNGKNAIVYIHGLGNTKEDFPGLWKYLDNKDYSILMYDAVGFGNSSKTKNFSYSMEDQAIILKKLLVKLEIEKAHIIGSSMGGAIALKFHQKFSEKMLSFISFEGNLTSFDANLCRKITKQGWKQFEKEGYIKLTSKKWPCNSNSLYKSAANLVKASDSGELFREFISMQKKKVYFFGEKNFRGVSQTLMRMYKIPSIMISNSGHIFRIDNPTEVCQKLSYVIE